MHYSEKTVVPAIMCDTEANLSPLGILQMDEDILTRFFGCYGIDNVSVRDKFDSMWVFTKNTIRIGTTIQWNKPVYAESVIYKVAPFGAQADVCMRDEAGNVAVYSRVEACVVNLSSKRIVRPSAIGMTKEDMEAPDWVTDLPVYRMQDKDFVTEEKRIVRATNLDMSHHTNNIEYLRFVLDTLPSAKTVTSGISEIQIEYLGQSYEGEELELMRSTTDPCNRQIVCGDRMIARCRIVPKAE